MRIYVGAFLTEKVPGENDHDLWRSQLSLKKKKQQQQKKLGFRPTVWTILFLLRLIYPDFFLVQSAFCKCYFSLRHLVNHLPPEMDFDLLVISF